MIRNLWPFRLWRKQPAADPWQRWGMAEDARALVAWVESMGEGQTALELAAAMDGAIPPLKDPGTQEMRRQAIEMAVITAAMLVHMARETEGKPLDLEGARLCGRFLRGRPQLQRAVQNNKQRLPDPNILERYNALVARVLVAA